MKGQLYVISAPSGAGKTSLVHALLDTLSGISLSISHTTRPARTGEEHGKHYYFVDVEQFEQQIANEDFLEYANVFGNYYGTSQSTVRELLEKGDDVILEIDWQGAAQIREKFADVISIFILPPSHTELENRLRNRSTDSDEVIQQRLQEATSDMQQCKFFDYIVINDNFDQALQDLVSIFHSNRLSTQRVLTCNNRFIQELVQ